MDPTACNYDAAANCDDGSCLTDYGCMDAAATNYNALANTHDATACTYNTSGSGCLVTTACNYSPAAGYTKDCNGVEGGSGADCCTMPSAAIETCYLDSGRDAIAGCSVLKREK